MTFNTSTIEIDGVAALTAAVASAEMVPTQISARKPKGRIFAAHTGSSIITRAVMNADYVVSGGMSDTQITFGWVLESDESKILTSDVVPGDFAIYCEGSQHDARHIAKLAYLAMTMDVQNLAAIADFEGIEIDLEVFSKSCVYRPGPSWAAFSVQFASQTLASLETVTRIFQIDSKDGVKARKMIVDDLARLLLHSLVQSDLAVIESNPISLLGRKVVDDVQNVLATNPENLVDMEDLCRLTGVSKRTMYRAFQSCVGMSPIRFIKLYRLSRAHLELCHSDRRNTQVGLVAHKWGFHHLGRFSIEYRSMFNQSPLTTLNEPSEATVTAGSFA